MKEKIRLEVCLGFGTVELDTRLESTGLCRDGKMAQYVEIWFRGAAA